MSTAPHSHHVEPSGALATARHYIRELLYGANDGVITTYAVVAGGGLRTTTVLIIAAGFVPLAPYAIAWQPVNRFSASIVLTMLALFTVGASRAMISNTRWWRAGMEMFVLGGIVAAAAFASGAAVAALVGTQ